MIEVADTEWDGEQQVQHPDAVDEGEHDASQSHLTNSSPHEASNIWHRVVKFNREQHEKQKRFIAEHPYRAAFYGFLNGFMTGAYLGVGINVIRGRWLRAALDALTVIS